MTLSAPDLRVACRSVARLGPVLQRGYRLGEYLRRELCGELCGRAPVQGPRRELCGELGVIVPLTAVAGLAVGPSAGPAAEYPELAAQLAAHLVAHRDRASAVRHEHAC